MQAYCANPYECTAEHPNSVYKLAERGSVVELLGHEDATSDLQKRVTHFIHVNRMDNIVKYMHRYAGKSLGFKPDTSMLTRIGRFAELEKLKDNMSDTLRRLVNMGLDAYEQVKELDSLDAATDVEGLPPAPEESTPEPASVPEPVPTPEPEAAPESTPEPEEENTNGDFVF